MNSAIFTFSKPNPESTVATNRLAGFIQQELKTPLIHDDFIAEGVLDVLFIINGAFAFCKHLTALGDAVKRAKRVVWIQQDWTISPPKPESNAESPFRKAFRIRAEKGLPPVDYWTTVEKNASATKASAYVNWNMLTYAPLAEAERTALRKRATKDLLYYGAFRANREEAFDRYFIAPDVPITISSTSTNFACYYNSWGPDLGVTVTDGMARGSFFRELAGHGLGLYIEDKKSHTEFHSPANRFYEMLSAGLPMVFQPECAFMLQKAGFEVGEWVIREKTDLTRFMKKREAIGAAQRAAWSADYVEALRRQVKKALKKLEGTL